MLARAGGAAAESAVGAALAAEGWVVLARNLRTAAGEIDLVAQRGDVLTFVEVKARPTHHEAAFALSARQQRRLLRAAEAALALHPHWMRSEIRFDVFLVDAAGRIARLENAFGES